jgi:hypothetical protein
MESDEAIRQLEESKSRRAMSDLHRDASELRQRLARHAAPRSEADDRDV